MIEIRVDALNLEQPLVFTAEKINNIDRLTGEFGKKVYFEIDMDSQRTLIYDSKERLFRRLNI